MTATSQSSRVRVMTLSAAATPLCLVAGLALGIALGSLVHGGLPGHIDESSKALIAAIPALAGVIAGGALWGALLARITGAGGRRRMAWAGALGFGPTVIAVAMALGALEGIIVERRQGPDLPVHQVFTLLFVPASTVVAAVGAWAVSVAARAGGRGTRVALFAGLAGGAAFLLVNLLMDAAGWRVGAPGAADRATMLTVAGLGALAAGLAGGAVLGRLLAGSEAPLPEMKQSNG